MAKALQLDDNILDSTPSVPKAALAKLSIEAPAQTAPSAITLEVKSNPKVGQVPLQVRWPSKEVKAAKLAAVELDFPTMSDFMLACFHEYMKTHSHS